MNTILKGPLSLICALSLITANSALAQAIPDLSHLPDFGSRADMGMSKARERMLGRSVVMQLQAADAILDDPELNEYIRLLGSQLVSQVSNGDFDFEFFIIDDPTVNAFAMPGGVVGVNAGLLLETVNESELAGVLAHEVSHVTQRHIARSMFDQKRNSILTIATMLAGALLGASGGSTDAAVGAITAAQAGAAQRQINFTRAHEYEADRVGMGVLSEAGFNPGGMASFFEKLSQRESRSGNIIPEMLRTHPMSSGRISEARSRARLLPRSDHEDSLAYGLAKARIRVLMARSPQDAADYYDLLADSNDPAVRYGRALSLLGIGLNDVAGRIFRELREDNPTVIAYRIGEAEALLADGLDDEAIAIFAEAESLAPRNVPLVIAYGEALLETGHPAEAHALLLDLLNNVDPTPKQIELLARAANAEGDTINAHHYMAEYYASMGNLPLAIAQLQAALAAPGLNSVQRARFTARIDEFSEYLAEIER